MSRVTLIERESAWGRLRPMHVIAGVISAMVVTGLVWMAGFDLRWSITGALVVLPVGVVLAAFTLDDPAPWAQPHRRTPRGPRLRVSMIEASLAACDRLAQPTPLRRLRELLHPERDDQQARANLVREVRGLLVAVLHDAGIDPSGDLEKAISLLPPEARAILQPKEHLPVTVATVISCLDAIERLASTSRNTHDGHRA